MPKIGGDAPDAAPIIVGNIGAAQLAQSPIVNLLAVFG